MKKKTPAAVGFLVFSLSIFLSACKEEPKETPVQTEAASEASQEEETGTQGEAVFGDFASQTLAGEAVDQSIFGEADLTMVNIWGTFCGPCINEMPDLGEISREYADKGVQIVGMVSDVVLPPDGSEPDTSTAAEIVEATSADYTHILLSEDLYYGYMGEVQVVPTTVFVDKNGEEVGVYTGSKSKEDWVSIIEEMLGKVSHEA